MLMTNIRNIVTNANEVLKSENWLIAGVDLFYTIFVIVCIKMKALQYLARGGICHHCKWPI
jgi:hypothetical protein